MSNCFATSSVMNPLSVEDKTEPFYPQEKNCLWKRKPSLAPGAKNTTNKQKQQLSNDGV